MKLRDLSSEYEYEKTVGRQFERLSGLKNLDISIAESNGEKYLFFLIMEDNNRFYSLLEKASSMHMPANLFPAKFSIKKYKKDDILNSSETGLFLKVIAESLTANRRSFSSPEEFFSRYIDSASQAEEKIVAEYNHIVLGRRGAGKSSLLLYSMYNRQESDLPFVWIDMQMYKRRFDIGVIYDILKEILDQLIDKSLDNINIQRVLVRLSAEAEKSESALKSLLPDYRRALTAIPFKNLFIFLDDFHVVDIGFQPKVLDILHSICRGTGVFLKLSTIETFTKTYDPVTHEGLDAQHDYQKINLDYNLTMIERSTNHIVSILDAYALYCGLPSIRSLCGDKDVLTRLVWCAAGVARDSLSIFSEALTSASVNEQKRVGVTDVNMAASRRIEDKINDIDLDTSGTFDSLKKTLDRIKDFCISEVKNNAFLVERRNDDLFRDIMKLIDLRLLHVIHEGITVKQAGKRYIVLILDYGYYVGFRTSRTINFFNKENMNPETKELRKLKIFSQ